MADLLEISRLQANGLRLELTEWPLLPLAEQVVERFAAQAGAGLTFELRIPADFPAVYADRERTRAVLENLVSNAVKYSPDGGVVRVTARAEARRGAGRGERPGHRHPARGAGARVPAL